MDPVAAVGERIERLLDQMESTEAAEELVHALMELYGAGLARILQLAGDEVTGRLAQDELVRGLLILHDLHPQSTVERVMAALDGVRPYLGTHAGDVDLVGVGQDGVVRLRLKGTCDGCPASTVTVKQAIEQAVLAAAPEVRGIVVQGMVPETGPGGRPLLPLEAVECPVPGGGR